VDVPGIGRRQVKAGFTLVEILVGLAIAGGLTLAH